MTSTMKSEPGFSEVRTSTELATEPASACTAAAPGAEMRPFWAVCCWACACAPPAARAAAPVAAVFRKLRRSFFTFGTSKLAASISLLYTERAMRLNTLLVTACVAAAALTAADPPKPKHVNRAIELLEQGQPIYYTGSHSGTEGSFEQGKLDAQTWAD